MSFLRVFFLNLVHFEITRNVHVGRLVFKSGFERTCCSFGKRIDGNRYFGLLSHVSYNCISRVVDGFLSLKFICEIVGFSYISFFIRGVESINQKVLVFKRSCYSFDGPSRFIFIVVKIYSFRGCTFVAFNPSKRIFRRGVFVIFQGVEVG